MRMQIKGAMFLGEACPERGMPVPFRTTTAGSLTPQRNQDVSLEKPQNVSDPQLMLL